MSITTYGRSVPLTSKDTVRIMAQITKGCAVMPRALSDEWAVTVELAKQFIEKALQQSR
jgi:hypothetical protein